MTWLMSERNTWSLDAMLLSGMLGIAEWTAKASIRLGVATKLPKVAAASYPKERPEPIRYAAVVAMPRAAPTTIGALGCEKALRSMAGKHTASGPLRAPLHLHVFWFGNHVFAGVRGRLHAEEAGVAAVELHQLSVRTFFDQTAVLQEYDAVSAPHGREPVRDVHGGAAAREGTQPFEKVVLGLRVERRRGLVEQQDLGVTHERARKRDLLPLPSRKIHTMVEPLAERGVIPLWKPGDELGRAGLSAGDLDPLAVVDVLHVAEPDVFRRGRLVGDVVLEHRTDLGAELVGVEVLDVDPIDQDPAGVGVVQAADQLEQGRLAGAVPADYGQRLARLDSEAEVGQRVGLSARVGECHVVKADLAAHRLRDLHRGGRRLHRRLRLHQLEQVVQVEVVLVHPRKAGEDALDRTLNRRCSRRVQREVAQREPADDRLQRYVQVGQ